MWTRFFDMCSGGGLKEPPYEEIYIEASEDEAAVIFYNRFGHNPHRVTCTCCGIDYSLSEGDTFAQVTGYSRSCTSVEAISEETNPQWMYIEQGADVPTGYKLARFQPIHPERYMTLEEYVRKPNVLVIPSEAIKPEERHGDLPQEGYVWV